MFDIGFSELLVIGVVALLVLGPERLPKVARTAGHLLGRLQRYVSDVKSDISREMQLEELRKLQSQIQQQVREVEDQVTSVSDAVRDEGRAVQATLASDMEDTASAVSNGTENRIAPATAPGVGAATPPDSPQLSLSLDLPESPAVSADPSGRER